MKSDLWYFSITCAICCMSHMNIWVRFSHVRYGILYFPFQNMRAGLFSKILNSLDTTLENLGVDFLRDIWDSVHVLYQSISADFPAKKYGIHIGQPEWELSCMKYVIFCVSHMKIRVHIFLHEIGNLYFIFEKIAIHFGSWYMEYCMFYLWI